MPLMGVPDSARSNSNLSTVTMAEKVGEASPNANGTVKNKQEFLNKLAGAKEANSIYKDGKKHNQIGKDEFMKLLSHQMQHQDPMSPMDQTKFVGELAQFAQLEQMTALNSKFDGMNKNVSAENKFYAASFIGKNVMTQGSTLAVKNDGDESNIFFKLDKYAEKVMVSIFDKKNNMVGEVVKENLSQGPQTVTWNGKNLDGTPATRGDYTLQIFAHDKQFAQIAVESKVSGTVTGVEFEDGETVLTVDGDKRVFLRDVDSFSAEGNQAKKSLPQAQMQAMNAYGKQMNESAAPSVRLQPEVEMIAPQTEMGTEMSEDEGLDYGE